ncbi:MAG: dual specificity protein phosphatase family protein [Gammaproteobacteria bacterium]|nr:dual specificity protein phosphatase family protein [Gammaproteobacteria bacterium]
MFIIKYYLLGAILSLVLAAVMPHPLLGVLFLWLALSFSLVSIAYLTDRPEIFRKSNDGHIPSYIRWGFIPFLLGVSLYNFWIRKKDTVPAIQKIDDNLYLGRRLLPSDLEQLSELGITAILDVTAEFDGLESSSNQKQFDYLNIPVLDHKTPSIDKVKHAIRWINAQMSDGGSVVIHCALGRGRSVFVMAAFMLSRDPESSVSDVLAEINRIRKTARLNKSQEKALTTFNNDKLDASSKTAHLIVNPVSGGKKWQLHRSEIIRNLTTQYALHIHTTTPERTAADLANKVKQQNTKYVFVGGGDGTLTEVSSELVDTDITLGFIPLGTANALCHVLYGITNKVLPVDTACDAILSGNTRKLDTVQCNDQLMLLMLGIGFEHEMIDYADREEKNDGGQLAYIKGFLGALNSKRDHKLTVRINDGKPQALNVSSLAIANTTPFTSLLAYTEGKESSSDGKLHITYIPNSDSVVESALSISQLALSGIWGNLNTEQVSYIKAKKVEISSDNNIDYVIDGELYSSNNIEISVRAKSLTVFDRLVM